MLLHSASFCPVFAPLWTTKLCMPCPETPKAGSCWVASSSEGVLESSDWFFGSCLSETSRRNNPSVQNVLFHQRETANCIICSAEYCATNSVVLKFNPQLSRFPYMKWRGITMQSFMKSSKMFWGSSRCYCTMARTLTFYITYCG